MYGHGTDLACRGQKTISRLVTSVGWMAALDQAQVTSAAWLSSTDTSTSSTAPVTFTPPGYHCSVVQGPQLW